MRDEFAKAAAKLAAYDQMRAAVADVATWTQQLVMALIEHGFDRDEAVTIAAAMLTGAVRD